ncbi:MAG: AAA family ATPase [Myxococcales bacterium]|nr:AAA family ATPase [Myxococcales bacterium]
MSEDGLTPDELALIAEEEAVLRQVQRRLAEHVVAPSARSDFDRELVNLRDQLAESRAEDHAMLVEHMTRLAALRRAQDRDVAFPADPQNPYFAHLRLQDRHEGAVRVRDVLIGRRAFIDTRQGVQVVDWRNSPISRIYYCYAEGDDYEERFGGDAQSGVVLARRTLTISRGELLRIRAAERSLVRTAAGWVREDVARHQLAGGQGAALRAPLDQLGGRPDTRLPEITALIDPEQFRIMTQDRSGIVIIRGGAGTGKTTIALHRAAWLHFQDPRKFAAKKMLVITPGEALRRYVSRVLPALDVHGVSVRTFADWAMRVLKRLVPSARHRQFTDDEAAMGARRLKRHPVLIGLLEDTVRAEARAFDDIFSEAGGRGLLDAWVRRRNLPVAQRLEAVTRWVDSEPALRDGVRVRRALERAREELLDPFETWATLLTDRDRLGAAFAADPSVVGWELDSLVEAISTQADDPEDLSHIDADRRVGIDGLHVNEGARQGRLDADDLAILLRICQLKWGGLGGPSGHRIAYSHLVVDEAQDLSPLTLKVLCEAVQPGGPVTLAGDTAQRLSLETGFDDWEALVKSLKIKANLLPPLAISYRSTRQVMELARHVLGPLAPDEAPRDARDGAPVSLLRFDEVGEAVAFVADALKALRMREPVATVALVARSPEVAELYWDGLRRADVPALRRIRHQEFEFSPGADLTDVFQIKGLEYDYVIVLEATAEHWPTTLEARHLLHVAMTRAAHQLWLLCAKAPSPLLPAALIEGEGVATGGASD